MEINNIDVYLVIFVTSAALQLLFWLTVFIRISPRFDRQNPTSQGPVSVVICARNEKTNLARLIPMLMEQSHSEFEVIVVDDASWDGTRDVLREMEERFPRLRSIELDEKKQRMGGKKFALTLGIKGAKYDTVLLTDADCTPNSEHWIKRMTEQLSSSKTIALGISPLRRGQGLFGGLFSYDAFHTAIQYVGLARAGMPYMGVGRNLAYSRNLFMESGGFKKHYTLESGDDDLFINEVANASNVVTIGSSESLTTSNAAASLVEWWRQKRRHFTTSPRYKTKHQLLLTLYPASYYALGISATLLLLNQQWAWLIVSVIGMRWLVQLALAIPTCKRWGISADSAWLSPLYELLLMILYPAILIRNKISKPTRWK